MIHLEFTDPTKGEFIYITTEDKRIDTSVPANNNQIAYLFKITNDMGKTYSQTLNNVTSQVNSQHAYGQSPVTYDRYTRVLLKAESTLANASVNEGKILALPVGFYKYEVYEATSPTQITTYSCATNPQTSDGQIGTLTVRQANFSTGTVMQTTNLIGDTYYKDVKVSDLTGSNGGSVGSYFLNMSTSCGQAITNNLFVAGITQVEAQTDGSRWLEITSVVTTSTGIILTIKSNSPVGYSYDFLNNSTSAYENVIEITTKPQTNSISLNYSDSESFTLNLYDSSGGNAGTGSKVWGINGGRFFSVPNPDFPYGSVVQTAWNPESVDASGTSLSKGSFYYNVRYGATINSASQNFFVVKGKIEEGKLYIKQGDENIKEVKYTKHESPTTSNYIYYGQ